jgi:hypothetical protein
MTRRRSRAELLNELAVRHSHDDRRHLWSDWKERPLLGEAIPVGARKGRTADVAILVTSPAIIKRIESAH